MLMGPARGDWPSLMPRNASILMLDITRLIYRAMGRVLIIVGGGGGAANRPLGAPGYRGVFSRLCDLPLTSAFSAAGAFGPPV